MLLRLQFKCGFGEVTLFNREGDFLRVLIVVLTGDGIRIGSGIYRTFRRRHGIGGSALQLGSSPEHLEFRPVLLTVIRRLIICDFDHTVLGKIGLQNLEGVRNCITGSCNRIGYACIYGPVCCRACGRCSTGNRVVRLFGQYTQGVVRNRILGSRIRTGVILNRIILQCHLAGLNVLGGDFKHLTCTIQHNRAVRMVRTKTIDFGIILARVMKLGVDAACSRIIAIAVRLTELNRIISSLRKCASIIAGYRNHTLECGIVIGIVILRCLITGNCRRS